MTRIPDPLPQNFQQRALAELQRNHALAAQGKSIEKEVYRDDSVKQHLHDMSDSKCAYCGISLRQDDRLRIEHYRPAGRVIYNTTGPFKPGYYWLAAVWSNFLPSCQYCNELNANEIFEYQTLTWNDNRVTGKGNHFPVLNPPTQKPLPAMNLTAEVPLLFDPCTINPLDLFDPQRTHDPRGGLIYLIPRAGLPPTQQQIADTSIARLGLNRLRLCTARFNAVATTRMHLKNVRDILDSAVHPTTKNLLAADAIRPLLHAIDPADRLSMFVGLIWSVFGPHLYRLAMDIRQHPQAITLPPTQRDIVRILASFRDAYSILRQQPAPVTADL